MTLTKYTHSCLFIEEVDKKILIDPGSYSYEDLGDQILSLPKIDYILITHQHPDHFDSEFVEEIVQRHKPEIVTNSSVADLLKEKGIASSQNSPEWLEKIPASHEIPLVTPPPENSLFKLFNRIVHPGDSLSYDVSAEILAMPIQGSWGSMVECLNQAIKVGPKKVIPIHDWHWNEKARQWSYEKAAEYLLPHDIEFVSAENGKPVTV